MRTRPILAALLATTMTAAIAGAQLAIAQPTPAPAPAPAPTGNAAAADAKIASAKQHYSKAEFGAALADLAEAYHLDPRPDLLYAMAQIEIELGDCAGAVAHYKQYLGTNPPAKAREAAEKSKAACEEKLGVSTTTNPPPDLHPKVVEPKIEPPHPPPPPPPEAHPFYADGLGDGLAIGAVVAGAVGGGLYWKARSDIDASETAATLQAHEDLVSSAHDLRTYAVIAGSVGGALAVGAIVRWVTHGGGGAESPGVSLSASPDGSGWGLAAVGRF